MEKKTAHKTVSSVTPAKSRKRDVSLQIEKRAFEIYLERSKANRPGTPTSDWLQAEAEVTHNGSGTSAGSRPQA